MSYKRNCEYCGIFFESKNKTLCCSTEHGMKLRLERQGIEPWRKEELEILENLSGVKPFQEIVEAVQRCDRKNGWKSRKREAVRAKLVRLGLSRKCVLDNFTQQELARALGVTPSRVRYWTKFNGLPCRKVSRPQCKIAIKDLREWAKRNHQRLAGIDYEKLVFVLDDIELAKQCSQIEVTRKGRFQPVRNVQTGEKFPTIRAAAKKYYISKDSIAHAAKTGSTAANYRWELITPNQANFSS